MSGDATSWRLVILGALIGISGPYGYATIEQSFSMPSSTIHIKALKGHSKASWRTAI
jgi:hypothetical protein